MHPFEDIEIVSVRLVKGVTIHYLDVQKIGMKLPTFELVLSVYSFLSLCHKLKHHLTLNISG